MLDLVVFLVLGIAFGVLMGLVPGIHPNMIILAVPLIASLNIGATNVIVFVVAMGVTNSIVDFIPSILLGAPDPGKELSVLPGHRLLLSGNGYEAVKLGVIGCLGGVVFVAALSPLVIVSMPWMYAIAGPYIYVFLVSIVLLMVLSEKGLKKVFAAAAFFASGAIGMAAERLPIDATTVLFPVFAGFFAVSMLLLQLRSSTKIPRQGKGNFIVPRRSVNRSVVFGSVGGIVSGFLPGVGSSEIAAVATIDKDEKSFMMTIGALTTANVVLSIMCLYLISRTRSGLAVTISQLAQVGPADIITVIAVSLAAAGAGCAITLLMAKRFMKSMAAINYGALSAVVIVMLVALTVFFTGAFGLMLLAVCTAVGVAVNLLRVKRGTLMGVLILPTILFYAGF